MYEENERGNFGVLTLYIIHKSECEVQRCSAFSNFYMYPEGILQILGPCIFVFELVNKQKVKCVMRNKQVCVKYHRKNDKCFGMYLHVANYFIIYVLFIPFILSFRHNSSFYYCLFASIYNFRLALNIKFYLFLERKKKHTKTFLMIALNLTSYCSCLHADFINFSVYIYLFVQLMLFFVLKPNVYIINA